MRKRLTFKEFKKLDASVADPDDKAELRRIYVCQQIKLWITARQFEMEVLRRMGRAISTDIGRGLYPIEYIQDTSQPVVKLVCLTGKIVVPNNQKSEAEWINAIDPTEFDVGRKIRRLKRQLSQPLCA